MANRATRRRNRSRSVIGGLTLAAMLAATRPMVSTKVFATGITYDWVRQNDKLDLNGGWYGGVASSADGSVLMSGVVDGDDNDEESPLYISRDNGSSWENIAGDIDNNVTHNWMSVDVSNNGGVLVAASEYDWDYDAETSSFGRIFVSENGGGTWADKTPDFEGLVENWDHIVVSGDGSRIVALSGNDSDNVYISDDGGDNWETSPVSGSWDMNSWDTLAVSDDGGKILFGGESWETAETELYLSENDGESWENITPDTDAWTYNVKAAIDSTGGKIAVALYGEAGGDSVEWVYVSDNDGAAWTDISPESDDINRWNAIALSDDGNILSVMGSWSHEVFTTDTDDVEWSSVHPGTAFSDGTINWFSADLNSDGSRFIGTGGEEVYTTTIETAEEGNTTVVNFANAENGQTVILTLPNGTTVTCHSAVKESGLAVQDAGYQYPLGLVDFCFSTEDESNEVSILFVTDLKPDQVVARKYNPNTQTYGTVAGVSITETTHNSQHALLVTYTLVDNGPLDTDPDIGEIADPVGIASTLGAPNTGVQSIRDWLFLPANKKA